MLNFVTKFRKNLDICKKMDYFACENYEIIGTENKEKLGSVCRNIVIKYSYVSKYCNNR